MKCLTNDLKNFIISIDDWLKLYTSNPRAQISFFHLITAYLFKDRLKMHPKLHFHKNLL